MIQKSQDVLTPEELKNTLQANEIKQAELARNFNVSKQVVNVWANHSISPPWQRLLIQYFTNKGIKIVKNI